MVIAIILLSATLVLAIPYVDHGEAPGGFMLALGLIGWGGIIWGCREFIRGWKRANVRWRVWGTLIVVLAVGSALFLMAA